MVVPRSDTMLEKVYFGVERNETIDRLIMYQSQGGLSSLASLIVFSVAAVAKQGRRWL